MSSSHNFSSFNTKGYFRFLLLRKNFSMKFRNHGVISLCNHSHTKLVFFLHNYLVQFYFLWKKNLSFYFNYIFFILYFYILLLRFVILIFFKKLEYFLNESKSIFHYCTKYFWPILNLVRSNYVSINES